jgi:RNA polymerase subunit RPABC4/transcription elongation factor Spt4
MKICPKCKEKYYNLDYKYCPKCSSELVDEIYYYIKDYIPKAQRKKCKKCNEFFNEDYQYCPFCSEKLVIEDIFSIDAEKGIVTGKWNDDLISISFEELSKQIGLLSDPPITTFFDLFDPLKSMWDEKFYCDLRDTAEKNSKLTFQEVKKLNNSVNPFHRFRPIKDDIGFKTLNLIKKEYGISTIDCIGDDESGKYKVIKVNGDISINFIEVRTGTLYYLIDVNSENDKNL